MRWPLKLLDVLQILRELCQQSKLLSGKTSPAEAPNVLDAVQLKGPLTGTLQVQASS